jgi:hypothetical protein
VTGIDWGSDAAIELNRADTRKKPPQRAMSGKSPAKSVLLLFIREVPAHGLDIDQVRASSPFIFAL